MDEAPEPHILRSCGATSPRTAGVCLSELADTALVKLILHEEEEKRRSRLLSMIVQSRCRAQHDMKACDMMM